MLQFRQVLTPSNPLTLFDQDTRLGRTLVLVGVCNSIIHVKAERTEETEGRRDKQREGGKFCGRHGGPATLAGLHSVWAGAHLFRPVFPARTVHQAHARRRRLGRVSPGLTTWR